MSDGTKRLDSFIREHEADTVKLLRSLVQIPTPTNTAAGGAYEAIAALLATKLDALGFKVQIYTAERGKPNVVGRLAGVSKSWPVHLNGHLDVIPEVPSPQARFGPYSAALVSGRVYGRGTLDMKGGLTAGIAAVEAVLATLGKPRHGIIVSGTVDEQTGGDMGMAYLVSEHPQTVMADWVLIPEPSSLRRIVLALKGILVLRITVKGASCFAGLPQQGINAIEGAAALLGELRERSLKFTRVEPLMEAYTPGAGTATLNIATIEGGTAHNVVPDTCSILVEYRFLPGETSASYVTEVETTAARFSADHPGLSVQVETMECSNPVSPPPRTELATLFSEAAEDVLGYRPRLAGAAGSSDLKHFARLGMPGLSYGPGGDERVGGYEEYIEVEELMQLVRIYARALSQLLGT